LSQKDRHPQMGVRWSLQFSTQSGTSFLVLTAGEAWRSIALGQSMTVSMVAMERLAMILAALSSAALGQENGYVLCWNSFFTDSK